MWGRPKPTPGCSAEEEEEADDEEAAEEDEEEDEFCKDIISGYWKFRLFPLKTTFISEVWIREWY
jgi:hypothetical protein